MSSFFWHLWHPSWRPSIQWTKFTWKLLMCTGACCLLGRVFTDSAGKITIFISSSALVPFRLWSLKIHLKDCCSWNYAQKILAWTMQNRMIQWMYVANLEEVSGSENCRGSPWNGAFEGPRAQWHPHLIISVIFHIGKNNNTCTVEAESSKFASLLFDQGFHIVIAPRSLASVPEVQNRSECHLTIFCINQIVVYYINCMEHSITVLSNGY